RKSITCALTASILVFFCCSSGFAAPEKKLQKLTPAEVIELSTSLLDLYQSQQVTSECIQQISATIDALIDVIFNCASPDNPQNCISSLVDLITELILIPLECETEIEDDDI
ncbi:MAG: hypothetical protein GY868_08105, partial [Deltaproteobacteria bacterium]|nr:hypothetical protein [Deltaproteobacteria bacterium]